jgi:homoserine dehydrogenase
MAQRQRIQIGLLGAGTVGTGVIKNLQSQGARLSGRIGVHVAITRIASRHRVDVSRLHLKPGVWTSTARQMLRDPEIDGLHPAKEYVLDALKQGKHVVTANKALLAEHGEELFRVARQQGVELLYEASVGGGIPIIKALREGLVGNRVESVLGIVNGTSNYILSQMSQTGVTFKAALTDAQRLGFAESNPALDVNGRDAAHKLGILTHLAFGRSVQQSQIHVEGIQHVEPLDIASAAKCGYVIKPLAIAKRVQQSLEVRVHPTLLDHEHVLANVNGVYNAIYVHGDYAGPQLFYGQGAGQNPTASAVVSDIAELAQRIAAKTSGKTTRVHAQGRALRLRPMDAVSGRYYMRFTVIDRPGVLARIATILGKQQISIATVSQPEQDAARAVPVIVMTHAAQERNIRRALATINQLAAVKKRTVALRIETPVRS